MRYAAAAEQAGFHNAWYAEHPQFCIGRIRRESNGYEEVPVAVFEGDLEAALAERIRSVRAAGGRLSVNLLTGASVASEAEAMLAEVDGIALRMPYQSEPTARGKINSGEMDYVDVHLSHVAQQVSLTS